LSRTLAIALVSVVALASAGAPAQAVTACAGADAMPVAATTRAAMRATICVVNEVRAARGLRPVRSAHGLRVVAERHSADMVPRVYLAHDTPGGRTYIDRILASFGIRHRDRTR
jgi:uncharacterized protein YkwD